MYLTQNGTTEVYRGKIQISPAEVGALPKINTLTLKGSDDNDWIDVGEVTTFNYTGRSDADGYVSRGFALGEKAFGIPCGQLGFNKQTPFTLTFWLYINRFNHETDGTQFLNVRTASDPWPASDWGYIWSTLDADGKFHSFPFFTATLSLYFAGIPKSLTRVSPNIFNVFLSKSFSSL